LPAVIAAVREAGDWLAAEFSRPGGPRAENATTAPIDREIELFFRARLRGLLAARFVGEEAGTVSGDANGWCWVVDPHDGTRAFLEGRRGSAVSVALLRHGTPVLGVVFAPFSPDRGADLIAWAEGGGITRNGLPVTGGLRDRTLLPGDVVFLNHGAGQRPVWNGQAAAPARFMPLPSIAYRLARVAAGDGVAALTLRPVNALDIAAGHALLLAAGGVLLAEDGIPVTYSELGESRPSACFGGAPASVEVLRQRTWRGSAEPRRPPRVALPWPRDVSEAELDRAVGCLLGQVIGDSLGGLVEFTSKAAISARFPHGVRDLVDGGTWNTLAGQPTDDSEMALVLARSLVSSGGYDEEAVAAAYVRWFESSPFDCGGTIARALRAAARAGEGRAAAARSAANAGSQANGSLMRVAPIGIWARDPETAARIATKDSLLTHPHPVCRAACGAFAAAISAGITTGSRDAMLQTAHEILEASPDADAVRTALQRAADGALPADFNHNKGWVLIAFQNAFYHLAAGHQPQQALVATASAGGDTDTNAAVAGALLGAAAGRGGLPIRWILPVLTCRPEPALGAQHPRPDEYWPDDLIDLAEALLQRRPVQESTAS
jgi:ADP-ribosylglycohydrolase/fructose-1,6-bisphosphatase/inositol monophosphatase family enzyme